jgi:putative ABC transport system substrate-binding protein
MRRREFITLIGGIAASWSFAAHAQQTKSPARIGMLPLGLPTNPYDESLVEAFRQGLREVGLIETMSFGWVTIPIRR